METLALLDTDALEADLEQWNRDHWQPMLRQLQEAATVMGQALEADMGRWRIMMMLPALDMRAVMVHGLVPYAREEA